MKNFNLVKVDQANHFFLNSLHEDVKASSTLFSIVLVLFFLLLWGQSNLYLCWVVNAQPTATVTEYL